MGYAAVYKPGCEPLDQFIRRKSCAGRFTRCLGRGAALDCEAQAKDPRLGNLRTLVRRRDRGRMASSP